MSLGFDLEVTSNARSLAKQFGELAHRQLPFATATALTRTAQDAQRDVRKTLDRHFKIRAKRRMESGIAIQRAEKRDWPRPSAKVGTKDEFMVQHVTGGTKRPQRGAKHVAIPARWIKRTATGKIPKPMKPRAIRDMKGTVVTPGVAIKRKLPGARAKARTRGLQTVFLLRRSVKIKHRWPFPRIVGDSARSTYLEHFHRELRAAVASARVRAGSFTSEQGRAAYLAKRTGLGRL